MIMIFITVLTEAPNVWAKHYPLTSDEAFILQTLQTILFHNSSNSLQLFSWFVLSFPNNSYINPLKTCNWNTKVTKSLVFAVHFGKISSRIGDFTFPREDTTKFYCCLACFLHHHSHYLHMTQSLCPYCCGIVVQSDCSHFVYTWLTYYCWIVTDCFGIILTDNAAYYTRNYSNIIPASLTGRQTEHNCRMPMK